MPTGGPPVTVACNWPGAVCTSASSWSPARVGSWEVTHGLDFLPSAANFLAEVK